MRRNSFSTAEKTKKELIRGFKTSGTFPFPRLPAGPRPRHANPPPENHNRFLISRQFIDEKAGHCNLPITEISTLEQLVHLLPRSLHTRWKIRWAFSTSLKSGKIKMFWTSFFDSQLLLLYVSNDKLRKIIKFSLSSIRTKLYSKVVERRFFFGGEINEICLYEVRKKLFAKKITSPTRRSIVRTWFDLED